MRLRPAYALLALLALPAARAQAVDVAVPGDFATIQGAIDGAPPDSVIQIAPGHYVEHLVLHAIERGLTLRGDPENPGAVVVDGAGVGPTIAVTSCPASIVIAGITFPGGRGKDGYGGGLFMANSAVAFDRCVFTGNAADLDGGGAFILSSGGLFRQCEFRQNTAVRYGGGVLVNLDSTTIFDRSTFTDNEAGTGSGGGVHVNDCSPVFLGCRIENNRAPGSGGGIVITGHFTEPESRPILRDCTITGNETYRPDSSQPAAEGGGIHIEDNVRAVLQGCRVYGNRANNGGGVNSYRAHYEIIDSVIESNEAVPDEGAGGFGGGLYSQSVNVVEPARQAATLALTRSLVRGNLAEVGAGIFAQGDFLLTDNRARLDVTDAIVADNVASVRGGGIAVDRTDAVVRGSHVLQNRVTAAVLGLGGGLLASGSSSLAIEDTTIAGNETGALGGGIFIDQGGSLEVAGSRLFANVAGADPEPIGGAIAVGQSAGPLPGPVSGAVQGSVIGENGANEIWEADCDLPRWSAVVYEDNTLYSDAGRVYYRSCSGVTADAAALNALSKASGNVEAPPDFASFAAAPASVVEGASSTLAWCVAGGGALEAAPEPGPLAAALGTVDVAPTATTTYALLRDASSAAETTVTVACGTLGTPVPRLPADGTTAQPAAVVTLSWHPAPGATAYDLVLDATDAEPTSIVAENVTTDSVTLTGLLPGTRYRWRVVARSALCADPVISPTFEFTTCDAGGCPWIDTFDDGDASDWTRIGKGTATVVDGALQLAARGKLTVLAPAPAIADGTVSLTLGLRDLGKEIRLLFGYVDERNYRALVIKPKSGRWMLQERSQGRIARVARTRRPLARGTRLTVRLDLSGSQAAAALNDTRVFSGTFAAAPAGAFGIRIRRTELEVDDVRVARPGG
jgi:hypothetical protein